MSAYGGVVQREEWDDDDGLHQSFATVVAETTYPARSDADTIQALVGETAKLRAENEALRTELADVKLGLRLTEPLPKRVGW